MVDFQYKDSYNVKDLEEIVRILRAPGGCALRTAGHCTCRTVSRMTCQVCR